jgi:hypothetical protein
VRGARAVDDIRKLSGATGNSTSSATSSAARLERPLSRLPPAAFTAYGLQSIIQHVAQFPLDTGTGC